MTRRDCILTYAAPLAALVGCGHKKSPRYQGYALIANHDSRTVAVIDLSRFEVLQQVPLEAPPSWILAVPSKSRAFVVSADSPRIEVLSLDSMRIVNRIPLGGKPVAARLSTDGESLWALLQTPAILAEIKTSTGVRGARVHLPARPSAFDLDAYRAALVFAENRTIGRYDFATGLLAMSPKLTVTPRFACLRPDGKIILTGNTEDRSISAIDTASLRLLVELSLPLAPRYFCFNSDGGQLFVSGDGMDAVAIVSPYQTEINETILAGNSPGALTATESVVGPQYLFVANRQSGDVTVINIDNRRVLARIPVGQQPCAILLTPDNEYALVLNEQSGDMAVIRLLSIRNANAAAHRARTAPLFTMIRVGSKPVGGVIAPRVT